MTITVFLEIKLLSLFLFVNPSYLEDNDNI